MNFLSWADAKPIELVVTAPTAITTAIATIGNVFVFFIIDI
ncbi:MAG TPA: hypothetical protein VE445_08915 [Nitrososphaeraceae archaeon]|jgi:hypothetical protein|nr:hypothetical protein [Nitrososphaeraceae archaeon]